MDAVAPTQRAGRQGEGREVRNQLYAQISEATFTAQVIRMARVFGWLTAHFRPGMTKRGRWVTAVQGDGAGFPDLVLIKAGKPPIFAELKAEKGKATPEQKKWLEAARAVGIRSYLWRPSDIDEIEKLLR